MEDLFGLYEKLVNPMSDAEKQNKRVTRKNEKKQARPRPAPLTRLLAQSLHAPREVAYGHFRHPELVSG
jgi:hypothetical protein